MTIGLQERISEDLRKAIKNKDKSKINCLKCVTSELQRRKNPHDKIEDKEIISLINKLIKSEKEVLKYNNKEDSSFIKNLEHYIPKVMNKEEIYEWIKNNIPDIFDNVPNERMKFMKNIMSKIGKEVNGNDVKYVLNNYKK